MQGVQSLHFANRGDVLDLIKRLGHDPDRVARLVITPDVVEVIYTLPIVEES